MRRRLRQIRSSLVAVALAALAGGVVATVPLAGVASAQPPGWSNPANVDGSNYIASVSCPTSAFCVAVEGDNVLTYNGKAWTSPTNIDSSGYVLQAVSCPTTTFCAAVDAGGYVVTFNGSSWSTPDNIAHINMFSVSCATASLCVAIDNAGDALLYNGSSWTDNAEIDNSELYSVSCAPGTTFCAAVDQAGNVITNTDGGAGPWTTSLDTGSFPYAVSCATSSFCVVVGQPGEGYGSFVYTTDDGGSSWSGPDFPDGTADAFESVSCATSEFCVAVDNDGYALLTTNGGASWSSPTDVDNSNGLDSVSCYSPTFCVTMDDVGNAVTYAPSAPAGLYVSAVFPYTGLTSGDTAVTITGSGFDTETNSANGVLFGTVAATSVDVVSDTEITADSPAESAGTVDVIVESPSGNSAANSADQFTYTVQQSPMTTSCSGTCSKAVATPLDATSVSATGSSTEPGAELSLDVNAGTLPCPGTYDYQTAVSTLSTEDFASNATVTVTETVGDVPSTTGVKVCNAPLSASRGTFLSKCHTHIVAPCLKSLKELYGHAGAVATFVVKAGDPRFWSGGGPLKVTSFSPTHGAAGSKVTVKGTNLTQALGVSLGGASAHITKATGTELQFSVPSSAATGLITVTAASGSVISPTAFTVS